MINYIDTEKLIAEIERRQKENRYDELPMTIDRYYKAGRYYEDRDLLAFIDSLQQEQQEVGLEKFTKKIKTFQGRYKHPEIVSIKGAMAFMARMFYQYPDVARQWYEQLPKTTMDFNTRKED